MPSISQLERDDGLHPRVKSTPRYDTASGTGIPSQYIEWESVLKTIQRTLASAARHGVFMYLGNSNCVPETVNDSTQKRIGLNHSPMGKINGTRKKHQAEFITETVLSSTS